MSRFSKVNPRTFISFFNFNLFFLANTKFNRHKPHAKVFYTAQYKPIRAPLEFGKTWGVRRASKLFVVENAAL